MAFLKKYIWKSVESVESTSCLLVCLDSRESGSDTPIITRPLLPPTRQKKSFTIVFVVVVIIDAMETRSCHPSHHPEGVGGCMFHFVRSSEWTASAPAASGALDEDTGTSLTHSWKSERTEKREEQGGSRGTILTFHPLPSTPAPIFFSTSCLLLNFLLSHVPSLRWRLRAPSRTAPGDTSGSTISK